MTLRPRVLIGARGSAMGLWVSKPGKNVQTASDDDMLLSPTNPSLAFLFKAHVNLQKEAQAVTVQYGTTLSRRPIVWAQVVKDDMIFLPPLQHYTGLNSAAGAGPRYQINAGLTSFQVTNLKNVAYTFQFMILHYPVE